MHKASKKKTKPVNTTLLPSEEMDEIEDRARRQGYASAAEYLLDLHRQACESDQVITTSDYSKDAIEFVDRIEGKRVVLINGKRLAQLMIDHDVGVSTVDTFKLKEISNDFFEEDDG